MAWYFILLIAVGYGIVGIIDAILWGKYTVMEPDSALDAMTVGFMGAIWPVSLFMLPAAIYDHKHGLD